MNIPRTPSPSEECCICLENIEKQDSKIWDVMDAEKDII